MASIQRFEELKVWVKAKELAILIYNNTNVGDIAKDYSLKDQIRRASVSVSSNIAEGFERNNRKEFIQYLFIAKGSVGELRSQLIIIKELKLINSDINDLLISKSEEISKMLMSLINYTKKSNIEGVKHKVEESEVTYRKSSL
ncbi:MAG: four helix bundle protein [Cytophagales bacterium]